MVPEILAPAGDEEALRAAVAAGADAVYFGLKAWSARARASNFEDDALARALEHLHAHGRKGYVAINTLAFDVELASIEQAIRKVAAAGADAVIVQDLGVAKMVRAIAPSLPIHASTQMTCTDASAVDFAASMGASRVILARELSLDDIAKIRERTNVELEVFVHGALCIAYSGQCLTSEAFGGRSANRGACAQSCRLPYDLVVDGELRDTGDRAFLLSPEDLEASALVPRLAELGVSSLKIEGRLKGPAYVAATTALYRSAVDALAGGAGPTEHERRIALQTFSRGSGPGFLAGIDHQRLVDGSVCDHRGIEVGTSQGLVRAGSRAWVKLRVGSPLRRGDGVLIQGERANEGETGGRVWAIATDRGEVDEVVPEDGRAIDVRVWLGPDKDASHVVAGRRVFKTSDPNVERDVTAAIERGPRAMPLRMTLAGRIGEPAVLTGETPTGGRASVRGDRGLERARTAPTSESVVREKLGRLGGSPFELGELRLELEGDVLVPPAMLNRMRRELVDALARESARSIAVTESSAETLLSEATVPDRAPAPAGLFVLCRTLEQAVAARKAGADGVWLDFLELQGVGAALRALRAEGRGFVGVAPPRIRKPGEEKIDRYLDALEPDGVLVRGLGMLGESDGKNGSLQVGDFSLNVTNRLSAHEILSRGIAAFTPSFDLDADQLLAFLATPFGPYAELVVHHPMPLFHMEHCVIAAELSSGRDHRDCGRPCDRHQVSLRDRAGMDHPVEADVGCRNTVFHAASQSAASLLEPAKASGVRRFRVELVREDAAAVDSVVRSYRGLLDGTLRSADVWRTLKTEGRYGVVRGSLRVLT